MRRPGEVIRQEREKMQGMSATKKLEYLLTNWWLEAFGVLIALGVIAFAIYAIWSAGRVKMLYLAVTDVAITEPQIVENCDAVRQAVGDTDGSHVYTADANLSTRGVAEEVSMEAYDYQQKALTLVGTGLVDAYLCTRAYADFLLDYDDLSPLREVLTPEQMARYADRIVDDYAISIDGTVGAEAWGVEYEPAYLVLTRNVHFPDVVRTFVDLTLEQP